MKDNVNHPSHYENGPACPHCGGVIECIVVTEKYNFTIGNAAKYLWRAGKKEDQIEDLRKAIWYVQREIERLSQTKEIE